MQSNLSKLPAIVIFIYGLILVYLAVSVIHLSYLTCNVHIYIQEMASQGMYGNVHVCTSTIAIIVGI